MEPWLICSPAGLQNDALNEHHMSGMRIKRSFMNNKETILASRGWKQQVKTSEKVLDEGATGLLELLVLNVEYRGHS